MFGVTLKRIVKAGYLSFRRNGWLSGATIMVMVLVLFVLGNLIFLGALVNTVLASLESKVDISIYFSSDAPEENILAVQKEIESLPDVKDVSYVSKDAALASFQDRHKNNALIGSALAELGENPLQASLSIKAKEASDYAAISDFLLKKNYPIVEKINYFENQKVIDRLGGILGTVRGVGAALLFFLAFIAVSVAFNTIRIAIYTMREEIGIMRLVGAATWFIRGPFLVNGLLYGLISAAATALLFFPLLWFSSPKFAILVPGFNLFNYFISNLLEFFLIMFASGIGIGVLSSLIAMRKYLKT